MAKKIAADLRFLAYTEKPKYSFRDDSLDLILHAVYITEENKVRNPGFDGRYSESQAEKEASIYDSFVLSAHRDLTSEGYWFGGDYYFKEVYKVDANRAESMAKTLRGLQRGLDRLNSVRGYSKDVVETFGRVAELLHFNFSGWPWNKGNAEWCPFLVSSERRKVGPLYDDNRYVGLSISAFEYWLEQEVKFYSGEKSDA